MDNVKSLIYYEGILYDYSPTRQRNKKCGFAQYMAILERGTEQ